MLLLRVFEVENGYIVSDDMFNQNGMPSKSWVAGNTEELSLLVEDLASKAKCERKKDASKSA